MVTRQQIVAEAREWIGTPKHHQGFLKNVGCDCGGLVIGVALATGLIDKDVLSSQQAKRYHGFPREALNGMLVDGMNEFLMPIKLQDAKPGDVLCFRWFQEPQHVGIVAEFGGHMSVIHTMRTVVEHNIDAKWRKRIVGAWALPGVVDA